MLQSQLLSNLLHNGSHLLTKKFGAAGRWMADAVCVHVELFELRGSDFSQRDDLIAWK